MTYVSGKVDKITLAQDMVEILRVLILGKLHLLPSYHMYCGEKPLTVKAQTAMISL